MDTATRHLVHGTTRVVTIDALLLQGDGLSQLRRGT